MKSSRLEEDKNKEDNVIKDVRNLFRLKKIKKETNDTIIKDIRKFFRLKQENKVIKDGILRDIRNLFEHKEEDYYKPVIVGNSWSNKTLTVEKYLNKVRPYLKDIIINLKKSDTLQIQLAVAINFISFKDNDEDCVIHSKSDNKEPMINDKAD